MTSWKLKQTAQCAKCPWRVDVDPHEIPNGYSVDKHAALASTIAAPGALPVGLQLVGRAWSEPGLLALAAGLELAFAGATWPRRPPALAPRATDRAGGAP